jgi:hypothetical protein
MSRHLLHVEEPIHQLTGLGPALFLYAAFRAKKTPPSGLKKTPPSGLMRRWEGLHGGLANRGSMARRRINAFNCVGCLPRPIPKSLDGLCAVADLWAPGRGTSTVVGREPAQIVPSTCSSTFALFLIKVAL